MAQPVRALVAWPAGLGDMEEFLAAAGKRTTFSTHTDSQFAWSIDGKQDTEAAKKVSGNATIDQPYEYAALMDLYFAAALLAGCAAARDAGYVPQHHRFAQRPERSKQREEAGGRHRAGDWRPERRYASCASMPDRRRRTS